MTARTTFAVLFVLVVIAPAQARPPHKKALAEHFGPLLVKKLNDCRTCHLRPAKAEDALDTEKPHNPFGARLKEVRQQLKEAGKKTAIPERIEAVAEEDSDSDGAANLKELLTGHNPGEPDDKPTADELVGFGQRLAEFEKYRKSYKWLPFEPVERPAVPVITNTSWVRNPIDAFIAAKHEELGLKPKGEAPKCILLRRIYLDLIGLPPTRQELHDFLNDSSPDAYEKVVDRLLASPRYGERWGRHWMDVWRYSDWYGFGQEVRNSQRHIWRWRDWIIESLNRDKSYDQMVREMLAGDEMAPTEPDTLRATGFLARNWYTFNRNVWLESIVEHTSKAFLGITMNCAKCHDHFFDPISQKEYFEFRAIFEPHKIRTDRVPGQADLTKDGLPRVYDADLEAKTHLFIRGNEAKPDKSQDQKPGVPAVLGGKLEIKPVELPLLGYAPDKREFVIEETLADSERKIQQAKQQLAAERKKMLEIIGSDSATNLDKISSRLEAMRKTYEALESATLALPLAEARHAALKAVIEAERLEDAGKKDTGEWKKTATTASEHQRNQALLEARKNVLTAERELRTARDDKRAELLKKLEEAKKALTQAEAARKMPTTTAYAKRPLPSYPSTSTGRRLALARWITDKKNPLAARVGVNHIWLRHFGKALAPTMFDFGANPGAPGPSHAALVDWLASELMDKSWSMKHIHRLIVTSSSYQMDSTTDEASAKIDPENRYLWRMNSRRLEAEAVRDSVLHAAGKLDFKMGGPDIDHSQGLTSLRRSVYLQHAAEKQVEFLMLFDAASVNECYERPISIVPQQALAMANSTLVQAQARLLARKLNQEAGKTSAFIKLGFEQTLGRLPTEDELKECEQFLAEQRSIFQNKPKLNVFAGGVAGPVKPSDDPALRARENLIQVLMNHNEFVTIR